MKFPGGLVIYFSKKFNCWLQDFRKNFFPAKKNLHISSFLSLLTVDLKQTLQK